MDRITLDDLLPPERRGRRIISPAIGDSPTTLLFSETEECPTCRGAGYYSLDVRVGHPDFGRLIVCDCRSQQRRVARERAARLLPELHAQLGRLARCTLDNFDLDRPFEELPWGDKKENLTPGQQRLVLEAALEQARDWLVSPGWLYLYGPYGSGKSHLAAALALAAAAHGHAVVYRSTPQALDWIRAGFADQSAGHRRATLEQVDLLVLDDIGAEQVTSWSEAIFFDLINERSIHERPTILTSNLPLQRLGGRIASRIAELAKIVRVIASDYRLIRHAS